MAGNLKYAAQYVNASRDELLELLERLLSDQETLSDKIKSLTLEVSTQRWHGMNDGYYLGLLEAKRKPNLD